MLDLTNKTAKQKAQRKSKELAKVKIGKFTKGDFDVEIVGDIKEIDGGIELFANASKNGKQCGFGKDGSIEIERFRFFNPPVLVDDINGDIITEWTRPNGKIEQRKLRYDSEETIKQILQQTISEVAKDNNNIVKGKIGNTTSTFYPSLDGGIFNSNASWATVRSEQTGTTLYESPATAKAGVKDTSPYTINRLYHYFDTSALSGESLTSAIFSGYCTVSNGTANHYVSLVEFTPSSDTALALADYGSVGTTKLANDIALTTSYTNPNEYQAFTLTSGGRDLIDKTGKTTFSIRERSDLIDENLGNVDRYWYIKMAATAGTVTDPKLVVVHEAGSSIKSINGLAKASIKSRNGLAIGSIKSINGLS